MDAAAAAAAAARVREAEIEKALRARLPFFRKQADSLTLEGVRRTLEKDMGLEIKSLDAHKKFIKQCVDKPLASPAAPRLPARSRPPLRSPPPASAPAVRCCAAPRRLAAAPPCRWMSRLDSGGRFHGPRRWMSQIGPAAANPGVQRPILPSSGARRRILASSAAVVYRQVFSDCDDENTNNAPEKAEAKNDNLSKEGSEDAQPASDKISSSTDEQGARSSETEKDPEGAKNQASGCDISEAMIKKAIDKRASYFRENSESLTLLGVRRTLEEDLKLEKKSLDAYKGSITDELDRVLVMQEPENGTMDHSEKVAHEDVSQKTSKGSKRARQDSDTSELNDGNSEGGDSDRAARPKKGGAEKGKAIKQQKKVTEEKKLSTPKVKKVAKRDLDKSAKNKGGNSAEQDNSHSSAEEDDKKRQQPAPAYGKQVERLKSIIKSCGMSIPPSVYRRAKQAPESKREAGLIKELEDILEKEGLSSHPSEKEIKAVKKRKERAKDLEGIDMNNIITSSRRRSASFIPRPVPKIEADSDDEDVADDEENVEGGDKGDDAESGAGSADDTRSDSD